MVCCDAGCGARVLRRIANLIESKGEQLASQWLADLERRGNALVADSNRHQLWQDARSWITLLLRAMRTGDIAPLHRASRLTARRLAVARFPLADAVDAIVRFKHTLWGALAEHPDLDSEAVHEATRVVAEWFDSVVLSMIANYDTGAPGDEARGLPLQRALRLSRPAEDQSAISQLTQEMASERDSKRLLSLIARCAAHLAGAQRAAVVVAEDGAPRYRGTYRLSLGDLNAYGRRAGRPLSGALEPAETRIVADLTDTKEAGRARAAAKLQVRTVLSVPMQVGDEVLGLVELFDPLAGQGWSDRDVALVHDLAAQAALAVENAQLLAEAERRAERLTALNEIGRVLASQISSPRLLTTVVASAARLLRASSALLWLREPRSSRFRLRAVARPDKSGRHPGAQGLGIHGRAKPAGGCDFDLAEGDLGRAAKAQASIVRPDASRGMPWGRGWAITAPLRIGARTFGLLVVQRRQGAFRGDDVQVLEALAGQIVVAIENAHLYEESERLGHHLNASIAALGDALAAALDMHELLQVIADWGAELAEAPAAIVFMDENGAAATARAVATRADAAGAAADPRAYEPLVALAMERAEPLSMSARGHGADEHMRQVMARERVRAVHVFPLTVRGRVAGALCILSRDRVLAHRRERKLLISFSRQAAVGIENVLLFNETQQRLAELADLSRASAGVTSTLNQTAIVEIVVEGVTRALQAPVAAMALLDEAGELCLPGGGCRGLPSSFVRRFAPGADSIARAVIADQRIKVIGDIAAEQRQGDSLIAGLQLGSLICAPIKGREGVLGILFAADRVPRTFRAHEEALLSAYANEAALALQNAFQHEAVARHARELEGILDATKTVTSTLELQPVLDHVAGAAASLLEAAASSIMLLDAGGSHLQTAAAWSLPPDHELHADLRLGESIPGMVALQGVAMSSTDLPRDGRFKHRRVARAEGLLSVLSVPLSVKGKPLGVISVFGRAARPFTPAQERLLTTLAAQASFAIENARLYAEAREQTRSMRLLMEEVNHRIKNNLQSITGIIQLHMQQAGEPRVQQALREIIGRVQAIAVVHEVLLDEDVQRVDVKETSRRILDNALRQGPNAEVKISGQVSGARVHLPSRQATSLACIINELVYNAVVHAFAGRAQGNIAISMQEATGGKILVQVADDGIGLSPGFDLERDARLGLRIVEGLVSQDLSGEFTIAANAGTIARITFRR